MISVAFCAAWLSFGLGWTSLASRIVMTEVVIPLPYLCILFVSGTLAGPFNLGLVSRISDEGELEFYFFGVRIK